MALPGLVLSGSFDATPLGEPGLDVVECKGRGELSEPDTGKGGIAFCGVVFRLLFVV